MAVTRDADRVFGIVARRFRAAGRSASAQAPGRARLRAWLAEIRELDREARLRSGRTSCRKGALPSRFPTAAGKVSCYFSSWRDLRRRSNAGIACWTKLEITPPSFSNHSRYGTILKALKLLASPSDQREECRYEICLALDRVEHLTAFARSSRAGRSKTKGGLLRYHAALRRLLITFDSLDPAIRPWFSLARPDFTTRTAIEAEITKAKSILDQPSAPPRRDGSRNQAAAAAAYDLLTWRGHNATATRGGRWEKLAKILAGDLTVDLFDHLRKFKQNSGLIIEKVRLGSGGILYHSRRREPGIKLSRKKSGK